MTTPTEYTNDGVIYTTLWASILQREAARRPHLTITTSRNGVFYLVRAEDPVQEGGKISFKGTDPMGRSAQFVCPANEAKNGALGITGLTVYDNTK